MWLKIPGIACISSGGRLCVPTILRWAKTPQNSVHMLPHLCPAAPCTSAKAHNLSWLPASSYCPHLKYAHVWLCMLYNNSAALQTAQNPTCLCLCLPWSLTNYSKHINASYKSRWSCILNMRLTGKRNCTIGLFTPHSSNYLLCARFLNQVSMLAGLHPSFSRGVTLEPFTMPCHAVPGPRQCQGKVDSSCTFHAA